MLITIKKSNYVVIGNILPLKALSLDDVVIDYKDTPSELVETSK